MEPMCPDAKADLSVPSQSSVVDIAHRMAVYSTQPGAAHRKRVAARKFSSSFSSPTRLLVVPEGASPIAISRLRLLKDVIITTTTRGPVCKLISTFLPFERLDWFSRTPQACSNTRLCFHDNLWDYSWIGGCYMLHLHSNHKVFSEVNRIRLLSLSL